MMKKLLLVVFAVLVAGAAAAQKVELGVRAGISSQDMELSLSDVATESKLGWHLAAVSRIRLAGFGGGLVGAGLFVQPEIVYSQNSYRMQPKNGGGSSKIRMQTIDVPVLASVRVSLVRVQAGPVFNLMNKYETVKGNAELTPHRSAVGYAVGASIDILGFTLDGRYHGEFGKLKNSIHDGEAFSEGVKGSLSSWSLGLSILF